MAAAMTAVTGRVVDPAGRGVPGVWVYPTGAGARVGGIHTDRDGAWRLDLPPGRWQVRRSGREPLDVEVDDRGHVATRSTDDVEPAYLSFDTDPGAAVPDPLPEPSVDGDNHDQYDEPTTARAPRNGGRSTSAPAESRRAVARRTSPPAATPGRPARTPRDGGRRTAPRAEARAEEN